MTPAKRKAIVKKLSGTRTVKKTPKVAAPTSTGWDLYKDGITQSMMSKFIICRHRFWIRYILGLSDMGDFNHKIEYGSMFHAAFEAFAEAKQKRLSFEASVNKGIAGIKNYCKSLRQQFPTANIRFWETLCIAQFKMYSEHWKKSDSSRKYIFQEEVFNVPTELPSGRVVPIRGKYDEGFVETIIQKTRPTLLKETLQENKIKGDVDQEGISTSLMLDLQTMTYLHSAQKSKRMKDGRRILYNVVMRPLGGKWGGLRQKKSETEKQFLQRVIDGIEENPEKNFHRWVVELNKDELDEFRNVFLHPFLEQLADWWDSIKNNPLDPWFTYDRPVKAGENWTKVPRSRNKFHFLRPFGVWDSLALGTRGDYFQFLVSGGKNRVGLKFTPLFSELTNSSLANR